MIYTSYFAKLEQLPKNIIPISICGEAPDWYKGLQYKILAPKYDFFMEWKKNHDNDYYIKCYNEQVLDKLNAQEVIDSLTKLVRDPYRNPRLLSYENQGLEIALICYEKPSDFCHRHLVAKWLTDNGFPCEEYRF